MSGDHHAVAGVAAGAAPVARRRRQEKSMFLIAFPLLIIPFALYNMIAFLLNMSFNDVLFSLPLLSGARMPVSTGDMLVVLSVLLLYVEIVKSTRLGTKAIMDHVLSLILFLGMAIEFMTVQKAASSTFLIMVVLSFVDVIGGFSITIRTAQRDFAIEGSERSL
jgi:hypothetical protein